MDILLDTHVIIWFLRDDPKLSKSAELAITDIENKNYVSLVSLWEIAIKNGIGKPILNKTIAETILLLHQNNIRLINIAPAHLATLSNLPRFDYHKDPFDRLLIAQAISEKLDIISADRHFADYPVSVIW